MVVVRRSFAMLAAGLLAAAQLGAQGSTGNVSGRVVDAASQQPLANVNIVVVGTRQGAVSQADGSFLVVNVPSGVQQVRASRIGFAPQDQPVVVTAGATVTAQFSLTAQAAVLSEVVSIGYGTQRREAITGSVATVDAEQANVGVVTNANQMVQGRVAGVQVTANSGEPGGGVQMRIRGGTSINASNTPLYVVDGVPLQNDETAPGAQDVGSISPALARSPLNAISPNDIEAITVLKDASATAIYGSRGANGVILITTKRGAADASGRMEYDVYVGAATPYKELEFASGAQDRVCSRPAWQSVRSSPPDQDPDCASGAPDRGATQEHVALSVAASPANRPTTRALPPSSPTSLGSADTDSEHELIRTGIATTHHPS